MYDCTHCFNCIEACPKGVAPMNQIMRLRRVSGNDHHIVDRNNGDRHERAFATLVKGYGLLHEAELLPRSYGGDSWFGKFAPGRRPGAARLAAGDHQGARAPQGHAEGRAARPQAPQGRPQGRPADLRARSRARTSGYELNLYITGYDEDEADGGPGAEVMAATGAGDGAGALREQGQPGQEPEDSPTR